MAKFHPRPATSVFNQIQIHRVDKRQSDVKEMQDGAPVATIHDKLSPDGKELTITTMIPGHPDQTAVWVRTGGAKVAHDPLAGEWTEDRGLSRMRQGTPLKIEADGSGGVRFTADYSYDAHFDGKSYNVKNSANDAVKLQLVIRTRSPPSSRATTR